MPNPRQEQSDESQVLPNKRNTEEAALAKLGKYVMERKVGSGGMGTVYAAIDQDFKRRVALKILPREKAQNPTLVKRFKAEARSAAQLEHQNIIRVYESGEIDGQLFIALEFVDGIDIYQLIQKRGRIPAKRSIEIMKQACNALQHAYEANVVHRDIKPSNLMLTHDGILKLADMGLARIIDDTAETVITRAGTTVGTVDYMAPEQARDSKAADIRSDIYSLGCTWYHMLTGKVPYPEGSMTNKLHAHATKAPPDPRVLNEAIPASIVAVIHKMMAKKKEDRYQTPAELFAELNNANLKRAEISTNSLEALAEESEDSDMSKAIQRGRKFSEADDQMPALQKPAKGKSSGQKNSAASNSTSGKSKSKSQNDSEIPAEEFTESGKYKKKSKKLTTEEQQRGKFQFDIKPIALLTFIGIAVGIGYGIIVILKGFGDVFDIKSPQAQLPINQDATGDPLVQDATNNPLKPAPDNTQPKAPTVDEMFGGKTNQSNQSLSVGVSKFGQEHFGSQQERLAQPASKSLDYLDKHLLHPDPTLKISIGKPVHGIPLNDTLNAALLQAREHGGVIEFTDSGPYVITHPMIIEQPRVILAAAPGVSPLIVYRPAINGNAAPMWQVNRGELQLRGVHLSLNPKLSSTNHLTEVIAVNGGMLTLVDASISLQGNRVLGLTAIALQNTKSPAICYMARSSIKGHGLQSLSIKSRDARVVIKQSLLISGSASVIKQDTLGAQQSVTLQDISLQESLLVADQNILTFKNSPAEEKPTFIRLFTKDTILGNSKPNSFDPLLKCMQWPQSASDTPKKTDVKHIQWQAESTVCSGWSKLVEINPAMGTDPLITSTVAEWNQLFDQKIGADFLAPYTFPSQWSVAPEKINISEIKQALNANSLTKEVREKLTALPLVNPLVTPLEYIRFDEMKLNPAEVKAIMPNSPILVCDLSRENLSEFLSNPKLPSPVVVEVKGVGIKQMGPCRINNKIIRLSFPQDNRAGGNSKLIIKSKFSSSTNLNDKQDELIRLNNSQLDIIGGFFQIPATGKDAVDWFISSTGSKLSLQNTYVEGPLEEASRHQGLIKLENSLVANQCYVLDSFLRTSGSAVVVEDRFAKLLINNSALVSFKSNVEIKPDFISNNSLESEILLQLNQSTFMSSRDVLNFTLPGEPIYPKPIGVLVSKSVFAPGLVTKEQQKGATSLVITNQPLEKLPEMVSWWGDKNAFSSEVVLVGSGMNQGESVEQRWKSLWQAPQELNSHYGADAAFLAKTISKVQQIVPEDLAMHQSSQAVISGSQGVPLGSDITQLQLIKSNPTTGNKPGTPATPNNPTSGAPKF